MPVYTFSCVCGWEGDQRTTFDTNNVRCPSCESTAHKESVYRLNFGGFATTPDDQRDFSRDYKAYSEASQEITYKSDRAGVDPPPLAQMAKAVANDLRHKGVTASDL